MIALRSRSYAAEIAFSVMLLLSAALLMRSSLSWPMGIGLDPKDVAFARPVVMHGTYDTPTERQRLFGAWLEHVAALPGVTGVGVTSGFARAEGRN